VALRLVFEQAGGRTVIEGDLLDAVLEWVTFQWDVAINNAVFAWIVWWFEALSGIYPLR
jgi:hypothetical protein